MKQPLSLLSAALAALALAADAADTHGRVQLWAGGPYWAETNVGADEPWEPGLYFWWGDTVGCWRENNAWVASDGSSSNGSFDVGNASTYGMDLDSLQSEGWITSDGVLAPAHDAAQAHWGGLWRMPTNQEWSDLCDNCDWTLTETNGVSGYVVRGRDDYSEASIFLPVTGYGSGTSLASAGSLGCYWSSVPVEGSTRAERLRFVSSRIEQNTDNRRYGQTVRPVLVPPSSVQISFDANGGSVSPSSGSYLSGEAYGILPAATREGYAFAGWFTDAGGGTRVTTASTVPASATTLYAHWTASDALGKVRLWAGGPYWAETNVGADEPWESGLYFWWGDTVGYRRENDAWVANDGSTSGLSFEVANTPTYGMDDATLRSEGWIAEDGVLAPGHDAARAHWSGAWRMPTSQELDALQDNCDWTWTTTNGVGGYVVRGRDAYSAASIFLPAAGYGNGTSLIGAGSCGVDWASVPPESSSRAALFLYFSSGNGFETSPDERYLGCTVRPVLVPPAAVTVTFNANGGSVSPSSQSYAPEDAYGSLPAATRAGYVFAGWFTEANGGTQVTAGSIVPSSAMTLYAHWTPDGTHNQVRLWAGGPYWAETNVGADEPWESGLYFWWGDTVGYRRENDAWVASDGSSSNFSFDYLNAATYGEDNGTLQSEGWITADGVLAPAHDAARAHWGGSWRMPTDRELSDLGDNCDWTRTTTNGVVGYVVRGRGDYSANSIFLPAAGYGNGTSLDEAGSVGYAWSSVPDESMPVVSRYLRFASAGHGMGHDLYRFRGLSVRPVQVPAGSVAISFYANGGSVSPSSGSYMPGEAYGSLPVARREGCAFAGWFTEANGGTQVTADSTVPASATTLYAHWTAAGTRRVQLWKGGPYWAETNVGADEPWDYGLYFWWGDTVGYRRENNAWVASDGSSSDFSFAFGNAPTCGKDDAALRSEGWIAAGGVLAPAHDAARAHWGGSWRMPTARELHDLCQTYCDWTWTTTNGVSGYVVRGRGDYSAASIFLPAAGSGLGTVLASSRGSYWSSVPDESYAACLDFHTEYPDTRVRQTSIIDRYYGHSVRPVWQIDLSTLSGDYTAEDGVDLVGETPYTVTVPGGSSVTVNGVRIAGGGGTVNPAPAFEADGEAVTTKFEKGAGDTWAITAFAELGNDALGKDVADDQIKVYAAETVEGLESAAPMSEGVTVTDRKSAVKVSLEVETPPGDGSRFFRVGFGE